MFLNHLNGCTMLSINNTTFRSKVTSRTCSLYEIRPFPYELVRFQINNLSEFYLIES